MGCKQESLPAQNLLLINGSYNFWLSSVASWDGGKRMQRQKKGRNLDKPMSDQIPLRLEDGWRDVCMDGGIFIFADFC